MNQDKVTHEIENDENTIDLTELLSELWNKAYIIILAGILAALVAFAGTKLFITPKYTATTSMYMLTRTEGQAVTQNELSIGTQLTQDYMQLVKSRAVLDQVISVLNLDMGPAELSGMITTENPENTRILTISVESAIPEEAQAIANAVNFPGSRNRGSDLPSG